MPVRVVELALEAGLDLQHLPLGGSQHGVEPPQHRERQDHVRRRCWKPRDRDLHPMCTRRAQAALAATPGVNPQVPEEKGGDLEPASGLEPLTC